MNKRNSSEVKLPFLQNKENTPFQLTNDHLILSKRNSQQKSQHKRIWEKSTSSCRNPLKRFDKFQTTISGKFIPINQFNKKEKKVIGTAMEIIQNRKKNKDLMLKNETIVDILEQKKEMFLVTMTHGIIEKQIKNLKEEVTERNKALKESNQILDQDIEDFQLFREKESNETKKIQEKYEKQVQKRLAKEQQIKNKQIIYNSLRAEKSRNEQNISSYEKYKKFLNQLPPKEWLREQKDKRKKKLQELKQKMQKQWLSHRNQNFRGKKNLKEEFEEYFTKQIESGENEEVEEILNNQEMYFKESHQLIEYFNNLEENNLFCIQNAQYAEQKYQELSIKSDERKNELGLKFLAQLDHKKILEKQLSELENQIKLLKRKKQQNSILDGKDSKDIKTTIGTEYQNMKENMYSFLPQYQKNAQCLSLLSGIQICMEKLWQKLRECHAENPKIIKEIKNSYEKKKNIEKREETTRNNKIQEEKRKIRNLQKKQPTMKMHGRIAMVRSPPADKVVARQVQESGKNCDDDRKYFIQ